MSERADFLVELGTEELPPKALLSLSESAKLLRTISSRPGVGGARKG